MAAVIILGLITLVVVTLYMYNEQAKMNKELNKKGKKKR